MTPAVDERLSGAGRSEPAVSRSTSGRELRRALPLERRLAPVAEGERTSGRSERTVRAMGPASIAPSYGSGQTKLNRTGTICFSSVYRFVCCGYSCYRCFCTLLSCYFNLLPIIDQLIRFATTTTSRAVTVSTRGCTYRLPGSFRQFPLRGSNYARVASLCVSRPHARQPCRRLSDCVRTVGVFDPKLPSLAAALRQESQGLRDSPTCVRTCLLQGNDTTWQCRTELRTL